MASIVRRKNSFCVVYSYEDDSGNLRQKWESFKSIGDAKKRKREVEYKQCQNTFIVPRCTTLDDLLNEYVALYGKNSWSLSTYTSNTGLIKNYIHPVIGQMKIQDITTRVIERYYQSLLKTKAVSSSVKHSERYVTASTVEKIHKVLRSSFKQAVKWELVEKNPCDLATLPKVTVSKRDIWTTENLHTALSVCKDDVLKLAINLSFACSLRIGELLALTWDCVDISQESIECGKASIYIKKELQRVGKETLDALDGKDILFVFPSANPHTKTVLVLKTPKTKSSVRRVFLPKSVAYMLLEHKQRQLEVKELLGEEYQDYDLVVAGSFGTPIEAGKINASLRRLIEDNNLPPVVFHSFRHSSITYKLKLNGGDVKAVQGDSGHSQATMVTDQYAHILDEGRCMNAQLLEEAFYSPEPKQEKVCEEPKPEVPQIDSIDVQALLKLLTNPALAPVLQSLVNTE